ncbi:MAG TPA: hypothetical protein VHV75_06305 [Solirubrobacteraceae bacterium]|nr:hypothetical protein [Solirubrobacteraceae bacterium]
MASLSVLLVALATSPLARASARITNASAHVDESQQDGYAQEAFTLTVSKGAQPIKSLDLGPPSGLQYGPVGTGLQITSAGKPVGHTAKHYENDIAVSFRHPVMSVRIQISSPAIHNCTAGAVWPVGAVGATGLDAGQGTIEPRAVTVRFIKVSSPGWWHPSRSAQQAVC